MRRLIAMVATGLLVAIAAVGTATASLPNVGICATQSAYDADVQTKLLATGEFSAVDLLHCNTSTPSVSTLESYSAVLVYSDGGFSNSTTLGNSLATFSDAGGRVVVATFGLEVSGGESIGGTFASGGYLPFVPGGTSLGNSLTLVADVPSSPLLSGVASFNGGTSGYRENVTLASGATQVAHWSDGKPLVAYKGNVVALNFYPPSSTARSDFWNASTDGAKLLANALGGQLTVPAPPPPPPPAPTPAPVVPPVDPPLPARMGYCSVAGNTNPNTGLAIQPGTFLLLLGNQPADDSSYTGATPANYLEGLGISCGIPSGYVASGLKVGYDGAGDSGSYAYYTKSR